MKAKISEKVHKQFVAMLKKSGAPPEMQAKLMPMADLIEVMGSHPGWAEFQQAAKLIVKSWGLRPAQRLYEWVGMLDKCLGVEVRIAEDKNLAAMQRRAEADFKRRTKLGEDTMGLEDYLNGEGVAIVPDPDDHLSPVDPMAFAEEKSAPSAPRQKLVLAIRRELAKAASDRLRGKSSLGEEL